MSNAEDATRVAQELIDTSVRECCVVFANRTASLDQALFDLSEGHRCGEENSLEFFGVEPEEGLKWRVTVA